MKRKTRYPHVFSPGAHAADFRGGGSRGRPAATPIMPEPSTRLPFLVTAELAPLRVWEVIESGAQIKIECDACKHVSIWTRGYMERTLKAVRGRTMVRLASKLRCGCGSEYVRLSKLGGPLSATTSSKK